MWSETAILLLRWVIGVLIVSLGIVIGGYVPFVFMPKGESDWIIAEVDYPLGTPFRVTEKTIDLLEKKAFCPECGLSESGSRDNRDLITHTFSLVGVIPRRDWKPGVYGGHTGEVWIELVSSAERPDLSVNTVISQLAGAGRRNSRRGKTGLFYHRRRTGRQSH